MRRLLSAALTGVLAIGCATQDMTGPPADPMPVVGDVVLARAKPPADALASWLAVVDDAIARLVPALGPSGAALATPFQGLRDSSGGTLNSQLLATIRKQFDAIAAKLPADLAPDADALRLTLDALGALAG